MSPSSIHDESVLVDAISLLSDPLSSMSSLSSLVTLLKLAYIARDPPPAEQGRLTTLMRTLSPEPRPRRAKTYSPDDAAESFINFLSPVLNGMAGMQEFEATVDGFAQPDNFRDFWTFHGHNLIRDMSTGDAQFHTKKGANSFLDVFCRDQSCRVALGRNTGCLMLVPGQAELGDEVWLADGALRLIRSRDGWGDVGEAFIHHL